MRRRKPSPLTPIFNQRRQKGSIEVGLSPPWLIEVEPDNATHAHTSTSPTVTGEASASPADAAHAHASTSPSVTTPVDLAEPADAAHAHASTSPTVTAETTASPADAAHAHASTSPVVSEPFSPDSIASLELWLDAEMDSGFSDDDLVATASDHSGNGRDFTESAASKGPTYKTGVINGLAVYRFSASDDLVAASNFASGYTAAEMFVVCNVPDATPPAVNAHPFVAQGQTSIGSHLPWTDGNIYESWGSTARKSTGAPSPSTILESFTAYNVRSASGSYVVELNGAAHYSTGTNTVGFSHAPRMGQTNHGGSRSWLGDVAAIYMFSAVLSSGERADLETYIAGRFGISFP